MHILFLDGPHELTWVSIRFTWLIVLFNYYTFTDFLLMGSVSYWQRGAEVSSYNNYYLLSCVWLFVSLWTAAHQTPLSTGFPRQEYWSGLPFSSPGDLPYPLHAPGIKPRSPVLQADSITSEPPGKSSGWHRNEHVISQSLNDALLRVCSMTRTVLPVLRDMTEI